LTSAAMYAVRTEPSTSRLALPQAKGSRPMATRYRSAIIRVQRPLPLGKGWTMTKRSGSGQPTRRSRRQLRHARTWHHRATAWTALVSGAAPLRYWSRAVGGFRPGPHVAEHPAVQRQHESIVEDAFRPKRTCLRVCPRKRCSDVLELDLVQVGASSDEVRMRPSRSSSSIGVAPDGSGPMFRILNSTAVRHRVAGRSLAFS